MGSIFDSFRDKKRVGNAKKKAREVSLGERNLGKVAKLGHLYFKSHNRLVSFSPNRKIVANHTLRKATHAFTLAISTQRKTL